MLIFSHYVKEKERINWQKHNPRIDDYNLGAKVELGVINFPTWTKFEGGSLATLFLTSIIVRPLPIPLFFPGHPL